APGDYVMLEVSDHGEGMPPEVLNQALFPFFTTKPVGQGTGLGLSVASGIVHGHSGWLTIESERGRGTCVRIYVPRLVGSTAPALTSGRGDGKAVELERAPSRHILVVDDEQAVLDVVRRFLEIAGHRVTCATTGLDALRTLSEMRCDLVVLD